MYSALDGLFGNQDQAQVRPGLPGAEYSGVMERVPNRSDASGCSQAPDDEAAAGTKVIEYFHIESALQFWAVATRLEKVKERANAANQPKLFGLRRTIIKTGRDG